MTQGLTHNRWTLELLAFALCVAAPARAQSLLDPADRARATQLFHSSMHTVNLGCEIESKKPFLDFAFRFDAGYTVRCRLSAFEGKESTLYTFVRVTPQGGASVLLGGATKLPAISGEQAERTNMRKMKTPLELSGGFSIGEGAYLVEVLVADNRDRASRKQWKIKTALSRADRAVPVRIAAHSVTDMNFHPWRGCTHSGAGGLRLTVLLDAAPINPRELKLRAWDRAFLLAALSSLLEQVPCRSVEMIAFNLDQQREVFRKQRFDGPGFFGLVQGMEHLELGTVSYQTLQRHEGWAELLAGYTNHEVLAEEPADVVLFLGPTVRIFQKIPASMLRTRETRKPKFFDFEFVPPWLRGREFDDTIAGLTKARDGTVLRIHSPGELAVAVRKMLKQVEPSEREQGPNSWPARPAPEP